MTENEIEPTCQALLSAIKAEDEGATAASAMKLLAGALVSLNRIAWFLEQISVSMERKVGL